MLERDDYGNLISFMPDFAFQLCADLHHLGIYVSSVDSHHYGFKFIFLGFYGSLSCTILYQSSSTGPLLLTPEKDSMRPPRNRKKDIILFDGICNFCNSYINYVITHDEHNRFVFASLQSDVAKELSLVHQIDLQSLNSIIVIHNKRILTRSDGIIHIAKHLKSKWSWILFAIEFIPQSIRNYIYTLIANRRYNWFGQMNSCMVPTPEVRDKFLT